MSKSMPEVGDIWENVVLKRIVFARLLKFMVNRLILTSKSHQTMVVFFVNMIYVVFSATASCPSGSAWADKIML